jgi:hypothetical protein
MTRVGGLLQNEKARAKTENFKFRIWSSLITRSYGTGIVRYSPLAFLFQHVINYNTGADEAHELSFG